MGCFNYLDGLYEIQVKLPKQLGTYNPSVFSVYISLAYRFSCTCKHLIYVCVYHCIWAVLYLPYGGLLLWDSKHYNT